MMPKVVTRHKSTRIARDAHTHTRPSGVIPEHVLGGMGLFSEPFGGYVWSKWKKIFKIMTVDWGSKGLAWTFLARKFM